MPLTVNAEFAQATVWLQEARAGIVPPPVGDVENRRKATNALFGTLLPAKFPKQPDVERHDITVKAADGFDIAVHIYKNKNSKQSTPGPAVFYVHGGGFIALTADICRPWIENYVARSGVPFYAVEYRSAPEHPFPTPHDDSWTAMKWLWANAAQEGIDPARIGIYGDSAGGNLAASLSIRARDENLSPPPKLQVIVSGMLDDRELSVRYPGVDQFATWTHEDNLTGWGALIGEKNIAGPDVSPYAAPARVKTVEGLPPAYIETQQLDLFRKQNADYAARLADADIDVEFHLWPGLPHGFDIAAPEVSIAVAAFNRRVQVFQTL